MIFIKNNKLHRRIGLVLIAIVSVFTLSIQPVVSQALTPKEFDASMDEGIWTKLDYSSSNDILYYDPNAGLGCISSGDGSDIDFSDVGGDVEKGLNFGSSSKDRPVNIAKKLMADFKFKDFQAAGIVGNFMVEAGVNVWPDINEGGSRGAPKFRGGYGFAQWTGARQVTFIDFAVKHGYMSSKSVKATDAANYAYLKYEMTKTAEKAVVPAIRSSKGVADAVTTWERVFERAGVPALGMRLKHGESVLDQLRGGTGDTTTVSEDPASCEDSQGGTTAGSVFDNVTFPLGVNSKQAVTGRSIFKNGTTERGGHPYIAFDILAPAGTKVVALTDGVVTRKHTSSSLADGVSIYNSDKKLHVYYTHMKVSSSIKEGDKVKPGDELGSLVSVKDYPAVNADHLHIDAGKTKMRDSCSRNNPNGPACHNRVDIGPDLYNAFQRLGGSGGDTKAPKAK